MTVAETFYPLKLGVHIANLRPKKWLSSEISDTKHGMHTPVCKHGKYPPPGFNNDVGFGRYAHWKKFLNVEVIG